MAQFVCLWRCTTRRVLRALCCREPRRVGGPRQLLGGVLRAVWQCGSRMCAIGTHDGLPAALSTAALQRACTPSVLTMGSSCRSICTPRPVPAWLGGCDLPSRDLIALDAASHVQVLYRYCYLLFFVTGQGESSPVTGQGEYILEVSVRYRRRPVSRRLARKCQNRLFGPFEPLTRTTSTGTASEKIFSECNTCTQRSCNFRYSPRCSGSVYKVLTGAPVRCRRYLLPQNRRRDAIKGLG